MRRRGAEIRPREQSSPANGERAQRILDQLDLERERRVRRNDAAGAARAVREIGWDDELPGAADLHGRHALVPSFDDLTAADGERERLAAIFRAVELLPVGEPARVVHDRRLSRLRRGARPDLHVDVLQSARGRLHVLRHRLRLSGVAGLGRRSGRVLAPEHEHREHAQEDRRSESHRGRTLAMGVLVVNLRTRRRRTHDAGQAVTARRRCRHASTRSAIAASRTATNA